MNTKATTRKMKRPGEANVLEMLLVTVVVIVGIAYAVIAFNVQDPLWFLPAEFDERPSRIELYHEGEKIALLPGDPGYEALVGELSQQLAHIAGYYEYGLRPEVLKDAYERYTTVVLIYDDPFKIRTQWNLGTPNRMLIPITGSGAGKNRVYTGTGERYGHGALILQDLSTFYRIVQEELGNEP